MKFWVPGANGLLGRAFLQKYPHAIGTGRFVDISDIDGIRLFMQQNSGISHIVNCAAFSLVDLAETKREEAYRTNAVGPENLAKVAKEMGTKLIHISTDYVFGGDLHRPLSEEDPVSPCNYYGETKLEGERRVFATLPSACVIRTSWIFGSGGKNFVSKLLEMKKMQGEVSLTNDHWNRPTYAPDLASAIYEMRDRSGLFHYANQGVATKYDFGLQLGAGLKIHPASSLSFPSPCKRPVYSAFDTNKIEQYIKIRPWQEALREFLCTCS